MHYAVKDLVELIKTYQSKNKLAEVLMSTSFKRRQDDLEAAIDRAIGRLQVSSSTSRLNRRAVTKVTCCERRLSLVGEPRVLLPVMFSCDMRRCWRCSARLWR